VSEKDALSKLTVFSSKEIQKIFHFQVDKKALII